MTKLAAALLAISAATFSLGANAATHTYEATQLGSSSGFSFPNLYLHSQSAKLIFEESLSKPPALKKLHIDFPDAPDLSAPDFKRDESNPRHFVATVKNAWVFKEVRIDVFTGSENQQDDLQISISVPDFKSNIEDESFGTGGIELVNLSGTAYDISPRRNVDSASFRRDGKRISLRLKDRPNSAFATPAVFGSGFEIEVDWAGYGKRTLYLPAPFQEEEFHHYTAAGIILEEINYGEETSHQISIRYVDALGGTYVGNPVDLERHLSETYAH